MAAKKKVRKKSGKEIIAERRARGEKPASGRKFDKDIRQASGRIIPGRDANELAAGVASAKPGKARREKIREARKKLRKANPGVRIKNGKIKQRKR